MIELAGTPYSEEDAAVVDKLNEQGLAGIIKSNRNITGEGEIPLSLMNPIGDRQDEPLSEFDEGIILRTYGTGNGQVHYSQVVLNALIATKLERPVIGVGFPNREWSGYEGIDRTVGWSGMSTEQRHEAGIDQYDGYAARVIEEVERYATSEKASLKLATTGESSGATSALSLAYKATDFDVSGVSIAALTNVEERRLYRGLFIEDFMNSTASLAKDAASGSVKLQPLVDALASGSDLKELIGGVSFLARDLFGIAPPSIKLYWNNRAFARGLTVPTAVEMIARLSVPVYHAGFENDLVSKPDKARAIYLENFHHSTYAGVDHGSCNRPQIILDQAARLIS
jgi:hypothetical protein